MQIVKNIDELELFLQERKGLSLGFVPTMGALHSGHISLVDKSTKENDLTIISIFVNPSQFNNSADLQKYPRTLEADLDLLKQTRCDAVFVPDVATVYPVDYKGTPLSLGLLEEVMEGKYRPGHFAGVMEVVERFFRIIQPNKAYFGRKDFQQVAVIRFMTKQLNLPIEIVECPTMREESGLAMSSRNMRLGNREKKEAALLYQSLIRAKELSTNHTPSQVVDLVVENFSESKMNLEYFDIVHPETLESLTYQWTEGATACIVAYCGEVRLIDNLELIPFS